MVLPGGAVGTTFTASSGHTYFGGNMWLPEEINVTSIAIEGTNTTGTHTLGLAIADRWNRPVKIIGIAGVIASAASIRTIACNIKAGPGWLWGVDYVSGTPNLRTIAPITYGGLLVQPGETGGASVRAAGYSIPNSGVGVPRAWNPDTDLVARFGDMVKFRYTFGGM
jgi:hypothetical protein